MPDLDNLKIAKDYHLKEAFANQSGFPVKGANGLSWGMKKHLANIFRKDSGKTVMFAVDHGYFMGSVAGLERLDLLLPRLMPHVDVLMATRGAIRSCADPRDLGNKAIALRASCGSSMIDEDLSHEVLALDSEEMIRMNADCIAVQVFIGADGEKESLNNLVRAVDFGQRYCVPVMGVVAVGKQMERTPRYFKLATRIIAELGANIVKTYYCEEFEEVCAACPVPIVMAGGKKLPEKEALELAYHAINEGAAGVDMGRNIFQSCHPEAMAQAISKIVHEAYDALKAYEYYLSLIGE